VVVKTSYVALTLRGNRVENGISVKAGQILFEPRWGMTRHNADLLAAVAAPDGNVGKVHVAVVAEGPVLVPCEEAPQRELVLVQQYSTGSGAKRWPGFGVVFGPEVRILSETGTSSGSGHETWVLVSALLGWAQNIACQFVDKRDEPGQTISFNPEIKKSKFGEKEIEVADSATPVDMIAAMNRQWKKF